MRLFHDSTSTLMSCCPGLTSSPLPGPGKPSWLEPLGLTDPRVTEWNEPDAFWDTGAVVSWAGRSQYDVLRDLDPAIGQPGNLACVALDGSGFHGQKNRDWHTAAGNLHLCLKVDLDLPAAEFSRPLVMLPAVVVMDVLESLVPVEGKAGIKWVNDILLDNRKLAGVLTSSRTVGGRLTGAVFGLGFNLAVAPSIEATCLADHLGAGKQELGRLLVRFLDAAAARLTGLTAAGPEAVIQDYRRNSLVLGREVLIRSEGEDHTAPETHRGRVMEILPDLSLRLEGVSRPVTGGRLTLAEPKP